VDRSTLIFLALLVALLILEFAWLEIRERRKKRKTKGPGISASSAYKLPRKNGENNPR
jgi:hypothetical protein